MNAWEDDRTLHVFPVDPNSDTLYMYMYYTLTTHLLLL